MAAYSELKAQLTDSQFIVYLALASTDSFKRVVVYENNAGLTGTLGAVGLGVANLTLEDLPAIVEASVLADAIRTGTRNKIVWNTIEVATQTGVIDGGSGSGEIDQDQLTAIMESIDTKVDAKTKSMFKYKGHVDTVSDLPSSGNEEGDVYRVSSEADAEYVWIEGDNAHWEFVGKTINLSNFYTKSEVDDVISGVVDSVTALGNATDTKIAAEEAARIQAVNAVANSVVVEESARAAAVQSIDEKISFAEIINRVWIYGDGIYDLNLMVKPGMYYCSIDANVVGTAMINLPEGTAEGCLLVLKNSQIFWEGGSNKGRTYYRYQTGAGASVSEYTETWTAGAMLSDVNELKEYFVELNRLQTGINESYGESIRTLTEAHYDLEEKVEHLDYTAFEVYPTSAPIAAGTIDEVTGLTYKYEVPAEMTARFILRTSCAVSESDVTVDWGDGEYTNIKDVPSSNTLVDGNELEVMVSHTYTESKRFIVKFFGKQYFGFGKINKVEGTFGFGSNVRSIVSRILAADLPLASHINCLCNIGAYTDRMLIVDVPTYMITQGMWNLSSMFYENRNLVKATGLRYFQGDIRSVNSLFSKCLSLIETDFIFPAYIRDNGGLASVFNQCPSLVLDIGKVFSDQGFIGTSYTTNYIFAGCASMTGIVPASKLWENGNIEWTKPAESFKGCPAEIRVQVPTSWGGTNTDIEEKLQNGYWKRIAKKDLATLESGVDELRAALSDARVPNVRFIDGGTVEEPIAIDLNAGVWYVALSPFTGALPDSPTDGTVVQISYEHGQNNMKIVPSGNDTINGSPNPCLIGISGEGVLLETDSHRLVYRSGNWILL